MSKGNIPDANAIHAARKKREAARNEIINTKISIALFVARNLKRSKIPNN